MDSLKTEKIRLAKQSDVFITKTATKTLTSTEIVDKVIKFHFKDLIRAFNTYSSVEITGFGRFKISQNKLKTKLRDRERYLKTLLANQDNPRYIKGENYLESALAQLNRDITYLKERIQENETKFQQYYRRMELEHGEQVRSLQDSESTE
jgi:nucleoid DNA-binding protein